MTGHLAFASASGAEFSPCGLYRYRLWRAWNAELPAMVFVMLNPSTADAHVNDPTIRKCIGFAQRNGCGGIVVVNLFAFRATNPRDLRQAGWPTGPDNVLWLDQALSITAQSDDMLVCAWGANARGRPDPWLFLETARSFGAKPMALNLLSDGTPSHPLMLPSCCKPQPYLVERSVRAA